MFYLKSESLKIFLPFLLTGLTLLSAPAFSDTEESMERMHKRMQGDCGDRMGYGMRDGRMGMMGGGMMGGGMMGGGMMGGGMMGGGMMGGGMMGGGMHPMMMNMLDLDKKQKEQIRKLMREQRTSHLKMMEAMMEIQDELAAQYDHDKLNSKDIGKTYAKMFEKKRKMIEQSVETRNKIRDVLNKEQRKQFDQMRRGGGMMGPGGGMGMMHGGMMR